MVAYFLDNLPHHLSGVPPDFVRHPAQSIHIVARWRAGLRPRSPSCPIEPAPRANSAVGRSRAPRQDDQQSSIAPSTSGGGLDARLVLDRRSCKRCVRRRQLTASTSLPVRARKGQQRIADRSFAETTISPPVLSFPYCIHHGRMRPDDCHARPGFPHRGWGESAEAWRA